MPRGDGTGPDGEGPMTGRRMGFCTGYNTPGYMNQGFGRGQGMRQGFGTGRNFGSGRFRRFINRQPVQVEYQEPTKEEFLKELENEKAEIEKTIKELKKEKK
jgi:hypothetical protein